MRLRISHLLVAQVIGAIGVLTVPAARADIVLLKSGKAVAGKVVRDDTDGVDVIVPNGRRWFGREDVDLVIPGSRDDVSLMRLEAMYLERAVRLFRSEQYVEAARQYDRAIALGIENADWYNNMGACYARAGQVEPALEALQRALALDPHHEVAQRNVAALYVQQGRYPEAMAVFDALLAGRPDDAELHAAVGSAWYKQGDYARAKEHFERAAALDPSDVEAQVNLAASLAALGALQESEQLLAAVVAEHPTQPVARRDLHTIRQAMEVETSGEAPAD